jgi:hypothetical protein
MPLWSAMEVKCVVGAHGTVAMLGLIPRCRGMEKGGGDNQGRVL